MIERALRTGEVSTADSRFYDFPAMPLQTKPYQERIPFWYREPADRRPPAATA